MKNRIVGVFFTFFLLFSIDNLHAQKVSDPLASKETVALFNNLYSLSKHSTLFGHQDDMAYGVKWRYKEGKSDIKSLTGEYPAIFGWDIGHLELGNEVNLDGVPFSKMQEYIIDGYNRGTAITISWHLRNPLTGGTSWDTTKNTVTSILKGGSKHQLYVDWLDKVAAFMNGLKGKNGEAIPVLFRPFHEVTGHWFWWCENVCSPEEFKELWRFTVNYLRNEKSLHHLLYVYNTAEIKSSHHFDQFYPGDDVVDVISMDTYQHYPNEDRDAFIKKARSFLEILHPIALEKKKIMAFAETGYEAIPDKQWWTKTLLPVLEGFPVAWVLVWRNHGFMESTNKMHYYGPYPGQKSARDFKKFYRNPRILFEKDIRKQHIYNSVEK
ncbi:MAG: glycosyl hydrolase [Ginsengibacter sp.]